MKHAMVLDHIPVPNAFGCSQSQSYIRSFGCSNVFSETFYRIEPKELIKILENKIICSTRKNPNGAFSKLIFDIR